jgi:hypothetical protein
MSDMTETNLMVEVSSIEEINHVREMGIGNGLKNRPLGRMLGKTISLHGGTFIKYIPSVHNQLGEFDKCNEYGYPLNGSLYGIPQKNIPDFRFDFIRSIESLEISINRKS